MICNSVIAIDNMNDYIQPINLIASKIPARVLEFVLKCPMFQNEKFVTGSTLLHMFAKNRGMISGSGMPNYAEAAKFILKKYVSGELVYACLPPTEFLDKPSEAIKAHQFNKVPEDY